MKITGKGVSLTLLSVLVSFHRARFTFKTDLSANAAYLPVFRVKWNKNSFSGHLSGLQVSRLSVCTFHTLISYPQAYSTVCHVCKVDLLKFLSATYHISSINRSSSEPTGCTQNSHGLNTSVTTTSSLWPFLKGYSSSWTVTSKWKWNKIFVRGALLQVLNSKKANGPFSASFIGPFR